MGRKFNKITQKTKPRNERFSLIKNTISPGNLPSMPKAAHGHMQPAKENGGHVTSIENPSCYYLMGSMYVSSHLANGPWNKAV